MTNFSVVRPNTIEQAIVMLNTGIKVKVIAGGTDVVIQLRKGLGIEQVVDVTGILDRTIEEFDSYISIGALATHDDVMNSQSIRKWAGVLAEACSHVAAPQIRNLGTIAGNIANASPAGDTLPALMSLGAVVVYRDQECEKTIAIEDFFTGPGRTKLAGKGIITCIRVPKMFQGGASFLKIGKRNALAISVCNCASFVLLDSERKIQEARIALGSVAPTPFRAKQTEKALLGQVAGEAVFVKAGEQASGEVVPITDVRSTAEYRKQVAGVLVRRTLLAAAEQASKRNR